MRFTNLSFYLQDLAIKYSTLYWRNEWFHTITLFLMLSCFLHLLSISLPLKTNNAPTTLGFAGSRGQTWSRFFGIGREKVGGTPYKLEKAEYSNMTTTRRYSIKVLIRFKPSLFDLIPIITVARLTTIVYYQSTFNVIHFLIHNKKKYVMNLRSL